jgi:hypothetical protein
VTDERQRREERRARLRAAGPDKVPARINRLLRLLLDSEDPAALLADRRKRHMLRKWLRRYPHGEKPTKVRRALVALVGEGLARLVESPHAAFSGG